MQQELFYLSLILCLGLIVTAAVSLNKYINMKLLFESADKTNDNLLQERMKISKKCTEFEEIAKRINKQLEEAYTTNSDQAKLIQKLTDELTIKNTTIESLTNHLKDKVKPFDPLDALDDLIPRRIETKKNKKKE